jgi:hypothetical protein
MQEGLKAMETGKGDLWLNTTQALPSTAQLPLAEKHQGSGDYSSQDGSLPSCSSTSSERGTEPGAADDVSALLKDEEVRAMLKKVTVNEGVLNQAIQRLGGGDKGLKSLMGYIMIWLKQQREGKSQQKASGSRVLNFGGATGDPVLQSNSEAFQILSGILQPPPTMQGPEQQPFQRFKSRRLMMGEPDMESGLGVDSGFCPSSFMNVSADEYSLQKPEMVSPSIMTPCVPQMNYGMPQAVMPQQPFTISHGIGMPAVVEQTPAMTTKAARRHRMARQRQSMMNQHHARAAVSLAAAAAVAVPVASVGSASSSWNNPTAVGAPMKKAGTSYSAQATPQNAPATATRKGRNMEQLTVLLHKELRPSDVGNLGRIILPKKEAEQHMPFLAMRGGVSIQMEDFDSGHTWNLRYRFWPNNKSRMYLLENTGEFVRSHRLVEGDQLILYRSHQEGYVLRGKKKKSQRLDVSEPVQVKFAHSSAKGSPSEEATSPKENNGLLIQRLYGGGPPDKCVKEEPVTLEDDPFLKEMMLSMGPSFESDSSCLQTLERFPSLNLDFPLDEIMAVTKTEPEG